MLPAASLLLVHVLLTAAAAPTATSCRVALLCAGHPSVDVRDEEHDENVPARQGWSIHLFWIYNARMIR